MNPSVRKGAEEQMGVLERAEDRKEQKSRGGRH